MLGSIPDVLDRRRAQAAFTLAEVVMSVGIFALLFAGTITAYVQASYRSEWSGYSLAAQSLAIQQLEQARAAVWDIQQTPVKNEITNILTRTYATLDLPVSGGMANAVFATNYATIQSIGLTNTDGVSVYFVKVDTVWPFRWGSTTRFFTNSIGGYFGPE